MTGGCKYRSFFSRPFARSVIPVQPRSKRRGETFACGSGNLLRSICRQSLSSVMYSVTKYESLSFRLRRKAFEMITVFCALGSFLPIAAVARDIYLAVRQDGYKGSGAVRDPFDVSSAAKYDAILQRFRENTNFFYSP